MTIHWHFEKSSPQTVTTGESDQSAGSHMRDAIQTRNSNIIRLPVRSSLPANLPLPAALYSRGEPPLQLSEFAQTSLDFLAVFVWLILPISFWGAIGFLGWVLFFA